MLSSAAVTVVFPQQSTNHSHECFHYLEFYQRRLEICLLRNSANLVIANTIFLHYILIGCHLCSKNGDAICTCFERREIGIKHLELTFDSREEFWVINNWFYSEFICFSAVESKLMMTLAGLFFLISLLLSTFFYCSHKEKNSKKKINDKLVLS